MEIQYLETVIQQIGSQSALARYLSVETGRPIRQGHVWSWLNRSRMVPAQYVIAIERHPKVTVSRHELRPDIYPTEDGHDFDVTRSA